MPFYDRAKANVRLVYNQWDDVYSATLMLGPSQRPVHQETFESGADTLAIGLSGNPVGLVDYGLDRQRWHLDRLKSLKKNAPSLQHIACFAGAAALAEMASGDLTTNESTMVSTIVFSALAGLSLAGYRLHDQLVNRQERAAIKDSQAEIRRLKLIRELIRNGLPEGRLELDDVISGLADPSLAVDHQEPVGDALSTISELPFQLSLN